MKISKSNVVAVSRNKEAIKTTYTRQSSNTTTDLTSCQMQFEACESFIKAHAGRGWRRIEEDFNDEGWSGATLDRPALQRLLAKIRNGEGMRPSEIAKIANEKKWRTKVIKAKRSGKVRGGNPWTARQVLATPSNPVYMGKIIDKDDLRDGKKAVSRPNISMLPILLINLIINPICSFCFWLGAVNHPVETWSGGD